MAMLNNQRVSISGYVNLWNVYGKSLGQIWFYGNICGKSLSGWWFGTWLYFSLYGNSIIPTDELMFFRGVGIPPTSSFCLGLPPHFPNFSLEQITNPKKPPTSFCFFVFRYNLLTNWGWTSSAPFLLFTAHSFYLGLPPLPPHFPIKMFGTNHKRHHQPVSVFGFFWFFVARWRWTSQSWAPNPRRVAAASAAPPCGVPPRWAALASSGGRAMRSGSLGASVLVVCLMGHMILWWF